MAVSKGMTVARLEALCGRLPGATRDIKWGADLVFSVGGKMFAVTPAEGSDIGRLAFTPLTRLSLAAHELTANRLAYFFYLQ